MSSKEKKYSLELIENGSANIVIGTHALIQESVNFHNLGMIVIDEQHRFGVMQRAQLKNKSEVKDINPHTLVMTATPIPRSLALTVFGDLDLTIIDEMPAGRQPISTNLLNGKKEEKAFSKVKTEIAKLITQKLNIPTIGIGSSVYCDGQVLVTDDLIGLNHTNIKFVKRFSNVKKYINICIRKYASDVRKKKYPTKKHSY